jgi:hypothetical protein
MAALRTPRSQVRRALFLNITFAALSIAVGLLTFVHVFG